MVGVFPNEASLIRLRYRLASFEIPKAIAALLASAAPNAEVLAIATGVNVASGSTSDAGPLAAGLSGVTAPRVYQILTEAEPCKTLRDWHRTWRAIVVTLSSPVGKTSDQL
jgi:hypothetical protein